MLNPSIRQEIAKAVRQLLRQRFSSALVAALIASSVLLPTFIHRVQLQLVPGFNSALTQGQVLVFFDQALTDDEAIEVSGHLLSMHPLELNDFVGRAEAAANFRASLGLGASAGVGEFPANASFNLAVGSTSADSDELLETISTEPGVDGVRYNGDWLARLGQIVNVLSGLGWVVALASLGAVFVTVFFSISLAVERDRRRIEVSKLVGGSDLFTIRPFVWQGSLLGLLGGVLAWLGLIVLLLALRGPLDKLGELYEVSISLPLPSLLYGLILLATLSFTAACSAAVAAAARIRRIVL
jgi:cell division transport system permease protein